MMKSEYYRVNAGRDQSIPPSPAHYEYGVEIYNDFFIAVRNRYNNYAGRVGRVVRAKDVRLWLQLYDECGDLTKETVLFYDFMLTPCPPPLHLTDDDDDDDELERELDKIFGFP